MHRVAGLAIHLRSSLLCLSWHMDALLNLADAAVAIRQPQLRGVVGATPITDFVAPGGVGVGGRAKSGLARDGANERCAATKSAAPCVSPARPWTAYARLLCGAPPATTPTTRSKGGDVPGASRNAAGIRHPPRAQSASPACLMGRAECQSSSLARGAEVSGHSCMCKPACASRAVLVAGGQGGAGWGR